MKTTHRFYLIATAVIVFFQLSFGFQSSATVYADDVTPTPTAARGCSNDGTCN